MKRTGDAVLAELVEPFSFPEKFVAISPGMLSKHVVDRPRDCSVNLRWRQVLLHPFLLCREKDGQTTSLFHLERPFHLHFLF